jgi:hypothetical protein
VNDSAGGNASNKSLSRSCWHYLANWLLLFAVVALGCGKHNSNPRSQESNLRTVAVLYSQFISAHNGERPQDENDFRDFVQSLGPGVLERAGFSGMQEVLLSRRDGQPFAVNYKSVVWKLNHVIAYEQLGMDGTRCIASDLGAVSEISEQQFQSRLTESR